MEYKTQRTLNGPNKDLEAANGVSAAVRQAKDLLGLPNPVKSWTPLVAIKAGPEQRSDGRERDGAGPFVCT